MVAVSLQGEAVDARVGFLDTVDAAFATGGTEEQRTALILAATSTMTALGTSGGSIHQRASPAPIATHASGLSAT